VGRINESHLGISTIRLGLSHILEKKERKGGWKLFKETYMLGKETFYWLIVTAFQGGKRNTGFVGNRAGILQFGCCGIGRGAGAAFVILGKKWAHQNS